MTPKLDEARLRELIKELRRPEPTYTPKSEAADGLELALDTLSAERERADRAVGLADYAAHDEECTVNRYPGYEACSCGLSLVLQSIRHDLATQKAEEADG